MEGEVIDSVTGEQLAAVVQSARGSQFELDQWEQAEHQLQELRSCRVKNVNIYRHT